MTRISLHATLVGIGLGLAGSTPDARAGGHFHHHKNTMTVETYGVAPLAMPVMTVPVVNFTPIAVPAASYAPVAVPAASYAPIAVPAAGYAPMAPSYGPSQQAPPSYAAPQYGIGDVSVILDLIARLRGSLTERNGGTVNPGTGASGCCPEVRINITTGGTAKVTRGADPTEGTTQDTGLETAINQLAQAKAQQMVAQATARVNAQSPAPAQLAPAPQPADDKEAQRKAILDDLEALKARVNALK